MIQVERMAHGVFYARTSGYTRRARATRCDPWDAARTAVAQTIALLVSERIRRLRLKKLAMFSDGKPRDVRRAGPRRADPLGYLNRTDEEVGHIAHIEECDQ